MDLADALLVWLADQIGVLDIRTLALPHPEQITFKGHFNEFPDVLA